MPYSSDRVETVQTSVLRFAITPTKYRNNG